MLISEVFDTLVSRMKAEGVFLFIPSGRGVASERPIREVCVAYGFEKLQINREITDGEFVFILYAPRKTGTLGVCKQSRKLIELIKKSDFEGHLGEIGSGEVSYSKETEALYQKITVKVTLNEADRPNVLTEVYINGERVALAESVTVQSKRKYRSIDSFLEGEKEKLFMGEELTLTLRLIGVGMTLPLKFEMKLGDEEYSLCRIQKTKELIENTGEKYTVAVISAEKTHKRSGIWEEEE